MTRMYLMSAVFLLFGYSKLLAEKDIAELGAEHFAKCSGLFAAAAQWKQAISQPDQAQAFINLSYGAQIAATMAATRKHGGRSKMWAANEAAIQKIHFIKHLKESDFIPNVYFETQLNRCYGTLKTQEELVIFAQELTHTQ